MKPSIAHVIVTYFTRKEDTVLDLFSGSGTIPFEACLNGRKGIGIDVSPFAFHLTRSKVDPPQLADVTIRLNELASYLVSTDIPEITDPLTNDEIKTFYDPRTFVEILKARKFLLEIVAQDNTSSFLISCIAHLLHGNRPYALSRRSHNMFPIPPKGDFEYKSLIKSLREKINRMLCANLPSSFIKGESYIGYADKLPLLEKSTNVIVTSPPFFGTTDFLRHNRIRLWFCGWDYKKQTEMKGSFLEQAASVAVYRPIFEECKRVLKDNGVVVIHLGVVKKRDMSKELMPLASESGFSCLGTVYEDTTKMETYGRTDRGSTHKHQFLFLRRQS